MIMILWQFTLKYSREMYVFKSQKSSMKATGNVNFEKLTFSDLEFQ